MSYSRKLILNMWDDTSKNDAKRETLHPLIEGIERISDIPYLDDGDKMHLFDIYYPENTKGKLPVIIDIHGGGWVYGDKNLNGYFCRSLATRGFVVFTMSYRLCPDFKVWDQISDVFAFLNWFDKNGKNYPCDMENVFIVGDSAGGHLAALTAAINLSKEYQNVYSVEPVSFPIRAVGCICAVTNMNMFLNKLPVLGEYGKMMFGENYGQSRYKHYVSFKDIIGNLNLPPFYVVSSKQDIYNFQSIHLDKVLTEHGIEHIFHNWPKGKEKALPHVFNVSFPEWDESKITNDEMTDFFKEHIVKDAKVK